MNDAPLNDAGMNDAGMDSAPSDSAPLLELRHLTTTIATPRGVLPVVTDASLTLARGATLGVVGETGSGKTMLIRSVMGLVPAIATRTGEVRLEGRDLLALSGKALAHGVWGTRLGMVFQDPMTSLAPALRIGRQLTDGLRHHQGLSRTDAHRRACELLAQVGMPEPEARIRQFPHELSGGLRQRVTIALALSCDPAVLLADEPTTALDVTISAQILDLLARLSAERSMGVVLVSHDLGVIASRTDTLCVMYAGRIVELAPTAEVFANPCHPYTLALMSSIPQRSQVPHTPLAAIAGTPPDLGALPQGCAFAPRCAHVQPRCCSERPPLDTDAAGHQVACFYPTGTLVVRGGGGTPPGRAEPGHQVQGAPVSGGADRDGVAGTSPLSGGAERSGGAQVPGRAQGAAGPPPAGERAALEAGGVR